MKKNILFGKFMLLFLLLSTFTACKKDKAEEEQNPPTKKELLSNTWKVSDVKNQSGTSIIALPIPMIVCLKDNIFTMEADNTYTIDEGEVVCDPSTAGSGNWELTDDDSKIKFTPESGDPLIFELISVNTTTLDIGYEITGTGNPDYDGVYTVVLTKN